MTPFPWLSVRWTRIIALGAALVLVPVGHPSVSGAVGPPVASDIFSRSTSVGWGAADMGGAYTYDGDAAAFGVDGSAGTMALARPAANVAALLRGVSLRDVDVRFRVAAGRPAGGALFIYVMLRQGGGSEYRPKVLINSDGTVSAHAGLIINGTESSLGPPVVVYGLNHAPGTFSWVRTRVTGASPTTVRVKIWPQGTLEPATWQFTATDSSVAVQDAGSVGFRSYLNSTVTNAPLNVALDDVLVAALDEGPPTSPVILAADAFNDRTESGEWGMGPVGGPYSYDGRLSDYSVSVGRGRLLLPSAGQSRTALLLSPWARDVDMSFAVSPDKLVAGASFYAFGTLRRATDGSAYRLRLRFGPDGGVFAHGVKASPNGVSALGPEVRVAGLSYGANTFIRAHVRAFGSNPTTVQIRAWADGQPEPNTWAFSATDSTENLQAAGALGLAGYLAPGATNAPLRVRYDDLLATTTDPGRLAGPTLVGAGDIAVCNSPKDEATSRLLDMIDGTVLTVGDNVYPDGTALDFANCYQPTWGRHKARTFPAVGNHEYHAAPDAGPYFDYFGAAAGPRGKGWYAYDVGSWRVYVLNSNCDSVGCAFGSEQEQWLRADLAANPRACSMAIWHAPRFTSGSHHAPSNSVQPFWQDLFDAGAELVLSGHAHQYERFAPMNAAGVADNVNGVRQFVIGTGGAGLVSGFATVAANSQVRQAWSHGVLKLTLGTDAFEWEFIPIAGQIFSDRGSGNCH